MWQTGECFIGLWSRVINFWTYLLAHKLYISTWVCKPMMMGSDATAAGGGVRELSEWPRSAGNAAAPSARRPPGTATGERWKEVKFGR